MAASLRRVQSVDCVKHLQAFSSAMQPLAAELPNASTQHRSVPRVPSLLSSAFSPMFEMEVETSRGVAASLNKMASGLYDRSASELHLYQLQLGHQAILLNTPLQKLVRLCKPISAIERKLADSLRRATHQGTGDIQQLAKELLQLGFLVQIRECAEPQAKDCLRNLRHRFLVCTGHYSDSCAGFGSEPVYLHEPLIVEPRFREQFLIGNPTVNYESLLQAVPVTFVGTLQRLEATVGILANEVQDAFRKQGRSLPPWRTKQAMLSKWSPMQITELRRLLRQMSVSASATTAPVPTVTIPQAVVVPSCEVSAPAELLPSCQPCAAQDSSASPATALEEPPAGMPGQQQACSPTWHGWKNYFTLGRSGVVDAQSSAAASTSPQDPAAEPEASVTAAPKPLPLSPLKIVRQPSSDLKQSASKDKKKAKSMLAAALQGGPAKSSAAGTPAAGKAANIIKTVFEEPWARITTVRWGSALPSGVGGAAAACNPAVML